MKQDPGSLPQRRGHGWTHPLLHAFIGTVCHFGDESQSAWGVKDRQKFYEPQSSFHSPYLSFGCVPTLSSLWWAGKVEWHQFFPLQHQGMNLTTALP